MSTQSGSWYIRGEGNRPTGPFTAEELIQSCRAGRLDASTICWREGMPQWLPLAQVEPFGPAVASSSVPGQATAAAARPPAQCAWAAPPPVRSASRSGKRRYVSAAWIGWAIAGGIAALRALVAAVALLLNARTPVKAPAAAHSGKSPSMGWGNPVRVRIVRKNKEVETTFLVGLKDAWYTDYKPSDGADERKTFVVVYFCKNLGPREGKLLLGPTGCDTGEIRTDKGRIYPGEQFASRYRAKRRGPGATEQATPTTEKTVAESRETEKTDTGGWLPTETEKIDDTSESALVFRIPKDEVPDELINRGSLNLNFKLPQGPFGFRRYSDVFGFLPQGPEEAVPGLIEALHEKDECMRTAAVRALAGMGPAAKDAVAALISVLLDGKERHDVRVGAVRALGCIGPAASKAIPSLNRVRREQDPFLPFGLRPAIYEALAKIGSARDAVLAMREDSKRTDNFASLDAVDELIKLAPAIPESSRRPQRGDDDKNQDENLRIRAANCLENLGPKARNALPGLKKARQAMEQMGSGNPRLTPLPGGPNFLPPSR